jgi:hypothetical protein
MDIIADIKFWKVCMKKLSIVYLFSLLLFVNFALAEDSKNLVQNKERPLSIDEQEKVLGMEQVSTIINEIEGLLNKSASELRGKCMLSFGNKIFCECLANKSPVISFDEYVAMTSKTKEELNYDKLSLDDQKFVDAVRKGRDNCVTSK